MIERQIAVFLALLLALTLSACQTAYYSTILKSNRAAVESDIKALVQDMNSSIAEADRFVKSMSTTGI